ncbi:FAD-dependent oxidoreductase [Parahaliea sp. F7430]|uniref:FAD-dependent oxidoreductase n=1 Tax=Sediminihaliea albiluteola TaxID=2758564 RepID=A0A7W2TVQ7_9GAMM|nr:FAD-dependent oxidoreductase [Sediminihaliea albiluteola]MBA6412781.1 FAD-dependent oxidoreductase [Sediminihaliea albiluteola]
MDKKQEQNNKLIKSTSAIGRRQLLAGMGALAGAGLGASLASASSSQQSIIQSSELRSWDITTDVLVAGSGAAGVSAAIEAKTKDVDVLLIESLPKLGGSSAMSGGVVYAGGGTSLQRALKIEDSSEAMYDFIVSGSKHPQLDKIQLYCESSPAHFDWLVAQGVPYKESFTKAKGLPFGDESLYYSGNELAWPSREHSRPAPRGHVPGVPGMNGGRSLMEALLARLPALGVKVRRGLSGQRLVVESDGRVVGMVVQSSQGRLNIRARRGIVLACGGFIHNRDMLQRYAPELFDCSVPWGNAGDLGAGINMGIAAGAEALRMHHGFAVVPIYPPENVLSGIVVNASGQRFISEESYHGVLGDAIAFHQQGKAWLITDSQSSYAMAQDNFPLVARSSTVGDLAEQVGFPQGALQHTVAYYNRFAENGVDPLFQKSTDFLRPLQGGPYSAWDLSVDQAFFPAHTFGGLHTDIDGQVINSFGEAIPGLYAAGRTVAGLPTAPYIASGLSVGDCTFFGRRAGLAAAQEAVQ